MQTNEERGRDRDVAFNDRKAHILIKEQSCVTSARRVNMDEKRFFFLFSNNAIIDHDNINSGYGA